MSATKSAANLRQRICAAQLVAFDFDGVFTDNAVYVTADGVESVRCWRGDGIGLSALRRLGVDTIVISTETNPVVRTRCEKLRIQCIHGVEDKRAVLEEALEERCLALPQAAFMGNDINDLPCLTVVGLPIVVQDAHEDVQRHAAYRTRARGGHGAVREVCDLFIAARGQARA